MNNIDLTNNWIVIFGGSSGVGLATVRKLKKTESKFFIVHRDRKKSFTDIAPEFSNNKNITTQNLNIHTKEGIKETRNKILNNIGKNKISLFLYSVTGANVGNITDDDCEVSYDKLNYTGQALAYNFHFWVKWFIDNDLLAFNARIIGLSYNGSQKAIQNYGYSGIAKATLEAINKYLACSEYADRLRFNIISAGIMDTPSSRAIPDFDKIIAEAAKRNPSGRLTQPEDVANVIYLLMQAEALWINGAIINVDGGEHLLA
ncbi:MAG: SDR family oxidoreductase [Bacteroidales bacterium]|nr:SDR family oxidoreductase [Bacteroidales bacterium]